MAKAIHTMVRVLDLDRSVSFYREAFGLEEAERFDFDDFVEAGFGPRDVVGLKKDGSAVGKFFVRDPDGCQIEVLRRGGRYH